MIDARDLRKEYGGFVAVEGSTFSVDRGEVFGVIGPNGAGKTTTLKMLSGLLEPTGGEVSVAGYDVTDTEMRQQLGFLPEESPLYEEMTADAPATSTSPLVGSTSPASIFRVVVFPAPFGPTTPNTSPGSTSNVPSSTATNPSYSFRRSSTRIIGYLVSRFGYRLTFRAVRGSMRPRRDSDGPLVDVRGR